MIITAQVDFGCSLYECLTGYDHSFVISSHKKQEFNQVETLSRSIQGSLTVSHPSMNLVQHEISWIQLSMMNQ